MEKNDLKIELRDYFAAKALQGLLANSYEASLMESETVKRAYKIADLMLRESTK